MNVWLSKCDETTINAMQNYASKNGKLLCLRDAKGKLLCVGLSVKALSHAKSKNGFCYYQVVTGYKPLLCNLDEIKKELHDKVIHNNFQVETVVYDVSLEIYEGKKNHGDSHLDKVEDYWFKSYIYYQNNKDKFSLFDLINKKNITKRKKSYGFKKNK